MNHQTVLKELRAIGDVQRAAEYLATQRGIEQQNAMDVAVAEGFAVEYYNDSIRVRLSKVPA